MNQASSSRVFRVALAICAVASIVPLFCARHLPMSDLPEHVAAMATVRHYGDPAWKSAEYFTIAGILETPYWLYHAVGAVLSIVTGSAERANLVMLALAGLGYPYALRALLVALRRDPRLALFGCALFWTNNLIVGLLNFVASVPVVLVALALVIRQAERPSLRRGVALAALALAIFYLHISSFGLFLVDATLLTLMLPTPSTARPLGELARRLRSLPIRLVWLAPSGAVGLAVFVAGRTVREGTLIAWSSRLDLLGKLPSWLFDCFRSGVDDALSAGLLLAFLTLLVITFEEAARGMAVASEDRWRSRCAQMLAGAALLVFIATPSQVGVHALLLDVRMGVYVALFAVTLPRVLPGRRTTLAFAAAASCALGLSLNTAYEVRAFERDEVAGFDDLLRAMPHGKRLVMLNFEPQSAHVNANVFSYFGSYYRARYGGVASFSFSETTHWPVRYRPGAGPPTPMAWGQPCGYRNQRDGAYFDYVLTRGERDPFASMPLGPRWELIGGSRAWRLYKKSALQGSVAPAGDPLDVGPCG